jgi:S1-C subfamily serine protease
MPGGVLAPFRASCIPGFFAECAMSIRADSSGQFANGFAVQVATSRDLVVAVRNKSHRHVSGLVWQPDVVAASEQTIGARTEYEVVTADGEATTAHTVGRDPGTNLLALRLDRAVATKEATVAAAQTGSLVLALGASVDGSTVARLGMVSAVGAQWYSRAGGRIEQRIALDIRLRRTEEGGAVIDPSGGLLGMSALGPSGQVIVIPHATMERVIPQILRDGTALRGWLGLGLQPVALPDALRDVAGQTAGMMVMSIAERSPAGEAGVKSGDILLSLNGTPVGRRLAALLEAESVGKTMTLRVARGGEMLSLETMISARPS